MNCVWLEVLPLPLTLPFPFVVSIEKTKFSIAMSIEFEFNIVLHVPKLYRSSLEDVLWKPCQNSTKDLWWKLYNIQDLWCMQKVYGKSFNVFKLYGGSSLLFKICRECKRFVVKSLLCGTKVLKLMRRTWVCGRRKLQTCICKLQLSIICHISFGEVSVMTQIQGTKCSCLEDLITMTFP